MAVAFDPFVRQGFPLTRFDVVKHILDKDQIGLIHASETHDDKGDATMMDDVLHMLDLVRMDLRHRERCETADFLSFEIDGFPAIDAVVICG